MRVANRSTEFSWSGREEMREPRLLLTLDGYHARGADVKCQSSQRRAQSAVCRGRLSDTESEKRAGLGSRADGGVRAVLCGRWAGPGPVCAMSDNLALCETARL